MSSARPVVKRDIPFGSDAEILEMVERFEQCRWPSERWTHRAHLAVAVVFVAATYPALADVPVGRTLDHAYRSWVGLKTTYPP